MRRRIPALVLTAVLAGGGLATVAQLATAQPAAAGSIKVNINQLRQQVSDLRQKAATLDHYGAYAEAAKARAEANAIQRRIDQLEKAERESGRRF
ncbi:hypothetical protein [Kitasatospora purpeofusca]|uniref:hypothetical protein n=1 Tax=Kitasatospora purpeofusca TaxID=67352 RepID=UPI00386F6AD8|nr:hypothetical protein OIP63_02265 [Kitasatospora purpeofusca]